MFLSLPSKRVPTSSSFHPYLFRPATFFPPNSTVVFCHSQISLICLIYLSLPNLYFCTIRSIIIFLKVLNKVNIRTLIQPKIVSYYWLTPICITYGVISYWSQFVWKEDHFCSSVVEVVSCSGCFKNSWLCTSPQLSWITRSGLASFQDARVPVA